MDPKKDKSKGARANSPTKTKPANDSTMSTNPAYAAVSDFLRGATAAQQAQVKMITHVFERIDADKDGKLSVADVRLYFRTIGRNASEVEVRRWIARRDMDKVCTQALIHQ